MWEVALSGGPCSGKTTSLARLPERLAEHSLRTLVIPEVATMLIAAGVPVAQVVGSGDKEAILDMEEHIFLLQREMRARYLALARALGGSWVILCDRGEMDHAAYMGRGDFESLLDRHGLGYAEVRDSYDCVVHMVSTAVDMPQAYTTENNTARYDSVERAAELDAACLDSWTGSSLVVVDNSTGFEGKLARVEQAVLRACGVTAPISVQRKLLLAQAPDLGSEPLVSAQPFEITQTYLRAESEQVERSVRLVRHRGQDTWTYVTKRPAPPGLGVGARERVEARISRSEYQRLLGDADPACVPVHKARHVFVHDNVVCRVESLSPLGLWVLEAEVPSSLHSFQPPPSLAVARDVTGDPSYLTRSLAERARRS